MRQRQSEKWVHPHPAAIVLYSLKQVLLLLVPIVRALFSWDGGFASWNDYMWVDILAILTMFFIGYLRYLCTGYQLKCQGILYKSGLILRKTGFIRFENISVTVLKRPIWFRPIGYCTVYIDTDAGKSKDAEFRIDLSLRKVHKLNEAIRKVCRDDTAVRRICRSSAWETLFLSFLSSDSLSGILFLSAAISGLGDFVSVDAAALIRDNFKQFYRLAGLLSVSIPPIAAWIAYILMLSWAFSFLTHAVRHLRFTVMRKGDELKIQSGIFSRYSHSMKVSKIGRIEMRQTLITRLIGIRSVFLQCCGYGKIDNSLAVLLPGVTDKRAAARLSFLLPEFSFAQRALKPKKRYLWRICKLPIFCILGCMALTVTLPLIFTSLADTLLFLGVAALFPCIWYLVVKINSYFHVGAARSGDSYSFYYTYGFRFLTTAVKADKITRIQISQTFWQKRSGGCDLLIYTRFEKRNRFRVSNLNRAEVEELFQINSKKA